MSFFANQSVAGTRPSIHHFRVNSSQYGSIIPIVYGRARIPGIFIWTGDFTATKSQGPGKGLGGTGGSFYNYSVSVEIALSQGAITSLGRSWHMGNGGLKRHTAAQTNSNWTLFPGAFGQAPWSYMTTRHPGQDLGYSGIAYLARSAWNLGTSGSPPQITFEVFGLAPYGSGVSDANPRDVINDILVNSRYGLGLDPSCVADLSDFSNYCIASSFFISPVFDQQKTMAEWMKLLLDCVHADAVWSNGQLKIVPYGDRPVAGNGTTWIPSVGPVYALNDDDFIAEKNSAPVTVSVTTPADRANVVNVEYVNAANDYNIETAEAKDEADIQRLGQRRDSPRQFHPITSALMARSVAQLKLQRSLYVANQCEVRVPQRYILAEPMDVVALTDEYLGLDAYPARIVEIEEEADDAGQLIGDSLLITLEDLGANSTPGYPTQPPGPWGAVDQNTAPNPINVNPIIFEPPAKALGNHGIAAHLKGSLELWVAASPQDADADWGGCNVYLSADNNTYSLIGRIRNAAAMGMLAAPLPSHPDPDTADTLQVDLSESGGSLTAASHALADAGMNLAYVDGELICFAGVAAGAGPNQFNLGYLRRGRYGTTIRSHAAGSSFAFLGAIHSLDPSILRIPLSNAHIGQTLYLKFASVNTEIDSEQDLAACAAYSVTIAGTAHQNRIPHRHVKKYRAATFYTAGAYVKPNLPNGFFYQAQNSGTSGGAEPAWPLGVDESVTDSGGIMWTAIEASPEIDDGSIPTSGLDNTPMPDVTGLTYAITKKGDIKLSWSFATPRPSNFSHFEIRQGASWAAGTFVDTTKRNQLLISDPAPGTETYWVGAINVALVADAVPQSVSVTMPSLPPVTGLTATVTKKQDVQLRWTKPSPFPVHFRAYEIRTDTNPGNAVNLVDHTKKTSYLITDPVGGATYYVYVLDSAGNYSAGVSVTATAGAPYKKSWLQLWSGLTADPSDNNRYQPGQRTGAPVTGTATISSYGGDWEVSLQVELGANAEIELYQSDGGGHGYLLQVGAVSGRSAAVVRWNGSAYTDLVVASGAYPAATPFNIIFKRHATGHFEIYVNGALAASFQDTTYGAAGPLYLMYSTAVCYLSNLVVRGGHADTPKAYKDANKRGLIDFTQSGHVGKHLGNIPDDPASSRYGVSAIDGNRKALIDFTQSGHAGKHLGNLPDDTTSSSGRRKAHVVDVLANRPAAGNAGALFHATDVGANGTTYRDTGTAWKKVGVGHLDDLDEGTAYKRIPAAVVDSNQIPVKQQAHLWSGLTNDPANPRRMYPVQRTANPVTGTQTNSSYQGDVEIAMQVELAPGGSIEMFYPDPAGNGYLFQVSTTSVYGIWKFAASTATWTNVSTTLENFPANTPMGVMFKYHKTGDLEVWVNGIAYQTARDTTYTPGGRLALDWFGAQSWVSDLNLRHGHTDSPARIKDPGKRDLIDFSQSGHLGKNLDNIPDGTNFVSIPAINISGTGANKKLKKSGIAAKELDNSVLAVGAVTTSGANSAAGTVGNPLANITGWPVNSYSAWTSLVSVPLNIQNVGDLVETTCVISAELNSYNKGNDDVEVRVIDDLGNVICTPQLAIGDFTRVQGQTDPTTYGGAGLQLDVLAGIDFGTAAASGSRTLTLQIRAYQVSTIHFTLVVHYARLAAKDFGA